MSDSYWRFVEPIWDTVSIYDGAEVFLRQFSKAEEKQRVLFATHWAQSEIRNGGLAQFLDNSTGVLAPEAVDGFRVIGMKKCASILSDAMKTFGDVHPRERSVREEAFKYFYEKYGEDAIPMKEHEDAMATEIDEENGGFEEAADSYANQS